MKDTLTIKKVLNNNVLIAGHPSHEEVVLIGKGIGFGKKQGNPVEINEVEKVYALENEQEQEQYKRLLPQIDEHFILVMNDIIHYIDEKVSGKLNEHIHVALTDHLSFAIKRHEQGLDLHNPFIIETETLYPEEYRIAEHVIDMLNERMGVDLSEGEIGFVALHIYSARSNIHLSKVNQHSLLINQLIQLIEENFKIKLDHDSVDYLRLVRHLHSTIERVTNGEKVEEPKKFALLLKEEYPVCYNLSWKLIKVMQQFLNEKVYEAEAVYLTMHLQRIHNK
ncbi:glucose PTS transporter transcription antiterminator GlcT [Bacillus solimangrovi]|uniref:PtsGHI operon antiterminator n=1 Tax=Bacillus solimangrovi TaxID=1305675 RepID=A0A1E5LJR8_9BACI|nr:transcription antiterminator [Bacillus solimangrovi]OEH94337.1 PtsGHI operon antiterminator [Bacillus solimangrovi]